uniref:phosphoribosylamine--glycine ligase n=2 Tax=Lotharella globosa TaxID=91324 RepID=A0A7S4DSF4_9EUKA|eukprot:CAMPEP_0167778712 /NCGR_PEP_ID=MMETSP0111_2-20121227/4404_1 /TAXON_ID=91324 /ORGANISM="Lotharella globosa, Strain CCCM811" /LENGTH=642 /DNA_ID=CAMNT_0007669043 /DNA_START=62 /DNA_END=1990 /DNA_ORIENTATION=+
MADSKASLATVLLIGSGGREHTMAWKLSQSPKVGKVLVAPGNGGTLGGKLEKIKLDVNDHKAVLDACKKHGVSLVAVGPEAPLAVGIADFLTKGGVGVFGPQKNAAEIEASKAFSKDFMARHNIPTAEYKNFTDYKEAQAYLKAIKHKVVIKASGLAAGKGVVLPETTEEALENLESIMVNKEFGDAGAEVVIEELLGGPEASCLAFTDGTTVIIMPAAQDHKRIFEGDKGPNTGGMGAYSPAPVLTPELREFVLKNVLQKAVDGLRKEGRRFVGVLYAGMMIDPKKGPQTLEFNCRFGDPETQVLLPLLDTDLYEVMKACVDGTLDKLDVKFKNKHAATIVAASGGYPKKYVKGKVITGTEDVKNAVVFHAGTKVEDGNLKTNGGRVLAVTGLGNSLREALGNAYSGIDKISFEGMQYRRDIAHRALPPQRQLRVAVLGSTRGTDLQAIIDKIHEPGSKDPSKIDVCCVVSNRSKAGILERAKKYSIPAHFVSCKDEEGKTVSREQYDERVEEALKPYKPDLILLIGYMRIVSGAFCKRWERRLLNVHPSLLPKYAGGMDGDVHEAVIKAGDKETGCTVHMVEEKVDAGEIIIQKSCSVDSKDTPETLKAKVQALEGEALIESIDKFRRYMLGVEPMRGGC